MFKEFTLHCMLPPDRLRFFGAFLGNFGFSMAIFGFLLQAGLKAMVVVQTMTKANPGNMGVENILPGLPTWFIPETAIGFTFWILVTALGFYCMHLAGEIKRIYSWNT